MPNPTLLSLQRDHLSELQSRYETVLAEHGYDSVLIASGAAPYRYGDDQSWVFHGYGPFVHWTGLAGQEHSWLWFRPGRAPFKLPENAPVLYYLQRLRDAWSDSGVDAISHLFNLLKQEQSTYIVNTLEQFIHGKEPDLLEIIREPTL